MADPRFFTRSAAMTLRQVAEIAEAQLVDGADPAMPIEDVGPLDLAGPAALSFLDSRKYLERFVASRAGACLVAPDLAAHAPPGMAVLLSARPYRGYVKVAEAFYPAEPAAPAIAPSAVIDPTAQVDATAAIGPGAVVGPRAEIGARCVIEANAVIGAGVVIGEDSRVGAGATLSHCLIGRRVVLYTGVRIGQSGFGFIVDPKRHIKVPQLGRVIVGDDVEIGANCTVDRGSGGDTVIGAGCMIDNLVQIGHNVEVGPGSVIVAQAGVAGSSKLGRLVMLAAQAGVSGHLRIGDGAQIGAKAGVHRDIEPGQQVIGAPAIPVRQFWRQQAWLARRAATKGE